MKMVERELAQCWVSDGSEGNIVTMRGGKWQVPEHVLERLYEGLLPRLAREKLWFNLVERPMPEGRLFFDFDGEVANGDQSALDCLAIARSISEVVTALYREPGRGADGGQRLAQQHLPAAQDALHGATGRRAHRSEEGHLRAGQRAADRNRAGAGCRATGRGRELATHAVRLEGRQERHVVSRKGVLRAIQAGVPVSRGRAEALAALLHDPHLRRALYTADCGRRGQDTSPGAGEPQSKPAPHRDRHHPEPRR